MVGNFSNGGQDTFDPDRDYVGIRLQQGVPLLDRDWNELEDIRRHYERALRAFYVGSGVPDTAGFAVTPLSPAADHDVLIGVGRCSVNGYDVENRAPVAFSEQGDGTLLPAPPDDGPLALTLYLEPAVERVDAGFDPRLANAQDVNVETCVRDRLVWAVRAVRQPDLPPPGTYPLADVVRPAGSTRIEAAHIVDRRRTGLSLAGTVDRVGAAEARHAALQRELDAVTQRLDRVLSDLDRLFWKVTVETGTVEALFGSRARIAAVVRDRANTPIVGAVVAFSTDWGVLEPSVATTGPDGVAAVDLIGVRDDVAVDPADIALLELVGAKVQSAMVAAEPTAPRPVRAIEYRKLSFEPDELGVISRYSPTGALVDIGNQLPGRQIVELPPWRTATVTVHVKESTAEAIVKAVGSIQVRFGQWVRDWARAKVFEITQGLSVGARIGDLIRQGVSADEGLLQSDVVTELLPTALQDIADDTLRSMKQTVFGDPDLPDEGLRGSGRLGQLFAEEATAAIGAKTQQAVTAQVARLVESNVLGQEAAGQAEVRLNQNAALVVAGLAQSQRQRVARVDA